MALLKLFRCRRAHDRLGEGVSGGKNKTKQTKKDHAASQRKLPRVHARSCRLLYFFSVGESVRVGWLKTPSPG